MNFLKYKDYKIPAVLAITPSEQQKGLMYENNLPPVMAFVYSEPRYNSFWMQYTPQPLDIIFCLKNKVVAIEEGVPFSTKTVGGNYKSDLILEMAYGNSKKIGMSIGDDIEMEYTPISLSKILLAGSLYH